MRSGIASSPDLPELDSEEVREKLASSIGSLEIVFHPADDEESALHQPLASLARKVAVASGEVLNIEHGDGIGLAALPCLTIAHRGLGKIHYQALPEGPELHPFIEALLGPARSDADRSETWAERLAVLERPAELLVFVGATCPHCPGAVRSANRIALASPLVTVSIIDAQLHPKLAERFNVRAVPLTILDEELAVTGVVRPSELVEKILSRGDESHERDLLLSLVEQGRFDEVAGRMQTGPGAAHFVALWSGSTTSLRIGLMMAVEEALEADRAALDGLVSGLLPILPSQDAVLRGDTADLLGRIGHRAARDALQALLDDPHPDVAEIASEALEEIDERDAD
jgi:alkyl hydroperoxide reductase subunit AhpF